MFEIEISHDDGQTWELHGTTDTESDAHQAVMLGNKDAIHGEQYRYARV